MWNRGRLCQPGAYLGMFVGSVVVDDEMNVEVGGDAGIQIAQEGKELLMAMARLAFGEDGASGDVEGREQGGGAVANVIVGDALDVPQAHGQHRLSAVQGLNLALFIDTKHQSVIGRVQIQADNVAHLFDEEGIGGDFEAAGAMRLHGESLEQPMHGGFGDAAGLGRLPHAPVRARGGFTGKGALQQSGDLVVFDTARASGPQFIVEPGQTMLQESLPPFADSRLTEVQAPGDLGVAFSLRGPQHQSGTGDEGMRQGAGRSQTLQLGLFVSREGQGSLGAAGDHAIAYPQTLV